ncbi:hypothetical protein Bbelb_437380 [Branchiostoma belcheri]|nr:hypothetical protein Bbelb_437380 [Branchiostoma belcheri]
MSAQLTRYLPELKSHGLYCLPPSMADRTETHYTVESVYKAPPRVLVPGSFDWQVRTFVTSTGKGCQAGLNIDRHMQIDYFDRRLGYTFRKLFTKAGKIPTSLRTSGLPDNDDPGEHSVNAQAEIGRHVIGMFGLLAKFGRMDKG